MHTPTEMLPWPLVNPGDSAQFGWIMALGADPMGLTPEGLPAFTNFADFWAGGEYLRYALPTDKTMLESLLSGLLPLLMGNMLGDLLSRGLSNPILQITLTAADYVVSL